MDPWQFYHFISEKDLIHAKIFGITEGIVALQVVPDPKNLKSNTLRWMKNIQWLCKNGEFIPMNAIEQGPPKSSMYPGRKSEYRITVRIPEGYRSHLRSWVKYSRQLRSIDEKKNPGQISLSDQIYKETNRDLGKPEDWHVFSGFIPPDFFREIKKNPSLPPDKVTLSPGFKLQPLPKILIAKAPVSDVLKHD